MTDTSTQPRQTPQAEPPPEQQTPWWRAEVDGRPVAFWLTVGTLIAAVTLGFGAWWTFGLGNDTGMTGPEVAGEAMTGGDQAMSPDAPRVPPVFGYVDGEAIAFVHTETSDPAVAQMLEDMMGSPVPVVPRLADVPPEATGTVVVFTNGLVPDDTPAGPFGFQPDVFDAPPGDPGYAPLRRIVKATWTDESAAELLTSLDDVQAAADAGLLELEDTGVIVNAPFLTWPGGQR
jgi:hypothetical protein